MERILIGYLPASRASGISTYLMHVTEVLHENHVQCDFLTSADVEESFRKEVESEGCHVCDIASLKHPYRHIRDTRKALHENHYDAVYLNISEALNTLGIIAAGKEKIPRIIVHSHSAGMDTASEKQRKIRKIFHEYGKKHIIPQATEFLTCSSKAAEWMYPSSILPEVKMIHNAVDYKMYQYDPQVRQKIRNQYHCEGKTIIGYVGSFSYQKNIFAILKIAEKIPDDCEIWMLGKGDYFDSFREQMKGKGLEGKIRLFGNVRNVAEMMQGMDCLILPSRFEGLPYVGIEAQAAGLPCLFSNRIAPEVRIIEECWFLDPEDPDVWGQKIQEISKMERNAGTPVKGHDDFSIGKQKEEIETYLLGRKECL